MESDPANVVREADLVVSAWKSAEAGAMAERKHLASGLGDPEAGSMRRGS